jgi:hypothetical protein
MLQMDLPHREIQIRTGVNRGTIQQIANGAWQPKRKAFPKDLQYAIRNLKTKRNETVHEYLIPFRYVSLSPARADSRDEIKSASRSVSRTPQLHKYKRCKKCGGKVLLPCVACAALDKATLDESQK